MALPNTIYLVTTVNIKLKEIVAYTKKPLNPKKLTVNVVDNSAQPHQQNHLVNLTSETIANYHINGKKAIFCSNRKIVMFVTEVLFNLFIKLVQTGLGAIFGLSEYLIKQGKSLHYSNIG